LSGAIIHEHLSVRFDRTTIRTLHFSHLLYLSEAFYRSEGFTAPTRMSLNPSIVRSAQNNDGLIDLTSDSDEQHPPELSIATYNIWFGTTGHEDRRMEAILENLAPYAPNLIGFQEVTLNLAQLLCPLLESLDYHTILQPFRSYGCAVACKVDKVLQSGFYPFANSQMDRGIVWALVEKDDREILFTTTHLESYIDASSTGGPEREAQLLEMTKFCEQCLQERPTVAMAIVTGDLNWDDERPRSSAHNRELMSLVDGTTWIDTYRKVEPKASGFTYDQKENPMLGGSKIRRRFDRILVRSRDKDMLRVTSSTIVGKEALPGLSYVVPPTRFQGPKTRLVAPSDHFGLVTKLEF
jgi:endonuclease/exonuclease/phosphatase family metal-dependent hydrolase